MFSRFIQKLNYFIRDFCKTPILKRGLSGIGFSPWLIDVRTLDASVRSLMSAWQHQSRPMERPFHQSRRALEMFPRSRLCLQAWLLPPESGNSSRTPPRTTRTATTRGSCQFLPQRSKNFLPIPGAGLPLKRPIAWNRGDWRWVL